MCFIKLGSRFGELSGELWQCPLPQVCLTLIIGAFKGEFGKKDKFSLGEDKKGDTKEHKATAVKAGRAGKGTKPTKPH